MDRRTLEIVCSAAGGVLVYGLSKLVLKRLAPPPGFDGETVRAAQALRADFEKIEHRSTGVAIVAVALTTWPIAGALFLLNVRIAAPSANPAFDGRRYEWWLLSAMMVALCVGYYVARVAARWQLGDRAALFDSYRAIRDGIEPRRGAILGCCFALLACVVFGWTAWNNGIIVDERGIAVRLAWYSTFSTYDEVVGVEIVDSGGGNGSNRGAGRYVRVEFTNSKPVKIPEETARRRGVAVSEVANYVAHRAKCDVRTLE